MLIKCKVVALCAFLLVGAAQASGSGSMNKVENRDSAVRRFL